MDEQLILDAICARAGSAPGPYGDALAVMPGLKSRRPRVAAAYARWLWDRASEGVAAAAGEGRLADAGELLSHVESMLRMMAPDDLDAYMLFTEWGREPAKRFWMPRRHVLMPLCRGFQDLEDGLLDTLVVSLPPRVGKSTTGVFAMSWHMGRHPLSANLMSGHSDKLTKGFHMEALSIIADETYRFADVFPSSPLADKSMADETVHLRRKGRFPSLTCRSVDGTLTGAVEVGREGWLYCDDLVSDREEALSVDRMDKLYAAYLNQLRDRMLDGAKEVHVGTRWVPNDVIGHVLDEHEGDPRCRAIVIPALGPDGETNFDYLFGLGFSTGYYERMRQVLQDAGEGDSWAAKYEGEPYWIGGLMFAPSELKRYDALPEGEPDAVIAVCDTKDRGADYAAMPIGLVYGDRHYIDAAVCDNGLPELVEPKLAKALVDNRVDMVQFESNSAGGRVADSVAEMCRERGRAVDVRKKFSTANKETRILVDSLWVKEHCYFRDVAPDADYARFMDMLEHYTTEGKVKHDDAPDAMSMYKRFATSFIGATVEPMKRPF